MPYTTSYAFILNISEKLHDPYFMIHASDSIAYIHYRRFVYANIHFSWSSLKTFLWEFHCFHHTLTHCQKPESTRGLQNTHHLETFRPQVSLFFILMTDMLYIFLFFQFYFSTVEFPKHSRIWTEDGTVDNRIKAKTS